MNITCSKKCKSCYPFLVDMQKIRNFNMYVINCKSVHLAILMGSFCHSKNFVSKSSIKIDDMYVFYNLD